MQVNVYLISWFRTVDSEEGPIQNIAGPDTRVAALSADEAVAAFKESGVKWDENTHVSAISNVVSGVFVPDPQDVGTLNEELKEAQGLLDTTHQALDAVNAKVNSYQMLLQAETEKYDAVVKEINDLKASLQAAQEANKPAATA